MKTNKCTNKMALLSILSIGFISIGFIGSAAAAPITITFEGTTSGSLGSTDFTNEAFVFTTFADTDNIQTFSNGVFYNNDLATIDILGSTYTITTPTSSNLNTEFDIVALGNNSFSLDALILPDASFSGWNMLSSFGATNVSSSIIDNLGFPMKTSGGNLFFNASNASTITFSATVVPVPAAAWLLASGLLGLVGIARRKHA